MASNTTANTSNIVSVFDTMEQAQAAVRDLVDAGISRSDISLVANDRSGKYAGTTRTGDSDAGYDTGTGAKTVDGTSVGENVAVGTGVGALGGLLIGLGALAIPGVGPIIAAGPLAATLGGALSGALGGGLIGALKDAGVPDDDAGFYAEHVRRGGVIVTVSADEATGDRVRDILDRHDPIDIEDRSTNLRSSGWSGFDESAGPYTGADYGTTATRPLTDTTRTTATDRLDTTGERAIPIVEEELQVGKREVQRGGVRVYSRVIEQPVEQQVNLREEHVRVERRPVNRAVSPGEAELFREQSIEVTETAEVPVVGKQARVTEEVLVGKDVNERVETVRDTVRRTDVNVEQLGTADLDADFRRNYQTNFAKSGGAYETYAPAYQYGYRMAGDAKYRGKGWSDVESTLKTDYLRNNPNSTWDNVKGAVRYGWEKVTGQR